MNREIEIKILNDLPLTEDEANKFLACICEIIRKRNQIYDPMDTNCKVCDQTSIEFGRLTLMKYGCDVELLDIKKVLQIPLTHYANFISLNVNGHTKTYLVDMTYSQFFGDSITLDEDKENGERVVSTKKIFESMKKELFVQQLRKKGFIELDSSILKQYTDAFLDLCGVTNKNQPYKNINKLLTTTKIKLVSKKNN